MTVYMSIDNYNEFMYSIKLFLLNVVLAEMQTRYCKTL